MNCEANFGFLPVAVIFSTMQEWNLFKVPIQYYCVLEGCFFKTPENISVPKLAILSAQKSFSRNVIFNKFETEKK